MFAGSTLPTPLYSLYQRLFGFSELTLTLIYAAYVLGNLSALLFLGRLSDQIGRQPVILIAITLGCASTIVFLCAHSPVWLACGRVLSGLALGVTSGTATAWLAELHPKNGKARATSIAVAGNMSGLALGAIASGLLAQYVLWPLYLPYVIYLFALLALGMLMRLPRETVQGRTTRFARLSLRPRLGVPSGIRAEFFAPAVTVFGCMALFGFYGALAPTILGQDLHQTSRAVSGGVVFELCIVAAFTVFATRTVRSRTAMLSGLALMLPSVALLAWAQDAKSMPILLIGTTLAGIAAALGCRGSLQVINEIAPADRRAEVVSSYLLAGFTGNSVPIIGVGVLSSITSSLQASIAFACAIAVFAATGLLIGAKYAPRS
jgi:MFS family permease